MTAGRGDKGDQEEPKSSAVSAELVVSSTETTDVSCGSLSFKKCGYIYPLGLLEKPS